MRTVAFGQTLRFSEPLGKDWTIRKSPDRGDLHKIVVLNRKGGCGKTTLATNIAAYYAMRGPKPRI